MFYTTDSETNQSIQNVPAYNYANTDYNKMSDAIQAGINQIVYIDNTVLIAMQELGHTKNIKTDKKGNDEFIKVELNPKKTHFVLGVSESDFEVSKKLEDFELIEYCPEGVSEEDWIDAIYLATKEGKKTATPYMVERNLNRVEVEGEEVEEIPAGPCLVSQLKRGDSFHYKSGGRTFVIDTIDNEDGLVVTLVGINWKIKTDKEVVKVS